MRAGAGTTVGAGVKHTASHAMRARGCTILSSRSPLCSSLLLPVGL